MMPHPPFARFPPLFAFSVPRDFGAAEIIQSPKRVSLAWPRYLANPRQ
jgi:hypothetical protein